GTVNEGADLTSIGIPGLPRSGSPGNRNRKIEYPRSAPEASTSAQPVTKPAVDASLTRETDEPGAIVTSVKGPDETDPLMRNVSGVPSSAKKLTRAATAESDKFNSTMVVSHPPPDATCPKLPMRARA